MKTKLALLSGLLCASLLLLGAGSMDMSTQTGTVRGLGGEAPLGAYQALLVQYATANTVTVAADALALADADGYARVVRNISLTLDISAAVGVNGPDASGLDSASAWRSIWVICKNDGTTVAGLLSASTASPTLPATYTFKRRVGWVRNNGTSTFLDFVQQGTFCMNGEILILSNGAATSNTNVDVTAFVPTTTRMVMLGVQSGGSASGAQTSAAYFVRPGTSWTTGSLYFTLDSPAATPTVYVPIQVLTDGTNITYRNADTSDRTSLYTNGYYDDF